VSTQASDIIRLMDMNPHPEGGWYCETFRDTETIKGRPRSTAIYFLLEAGQFSRWHRVDAVEVWHWYGGSSISLMISEDGVSSQTSILGPDIIAGERPQIIVPDMAWQSARPDGDWSLVGCTVSPGFQFSGFEMAKPGWEPGS